MAAQLLSSNCCNVNACSSAYHHLNTSFMISKKILEPVSNDECDSDPVT